MSLKDRIKQMAGDAEQEIDPEEVSTNRSYQRDI